MAISYVGAGAQTASFGSPISPALPAGVQEGDLILLCIQVGTAVNSGSPPIPTAAGYGMLLNAFSDDAPSTQHCPILYKFAGASESAPSVAMSPVNGGWSIRSVAYRGVDTDNPIDTIAPLDITGDLSLTPPGITTKTDGAMVLAFAGFGNDANPQLSAAQGFTTRVAEQTATGDNGYVLADQLVATAGAVTAPTFAQDLGTGVLAQLVALRESGRSYSSVNMIVSDGITEADATTIDVPLPDVVESGDLIVIACYHGNSTPQTFSAPDFTDVAHASNNGTLALLAKLADGTEGTAITVTASTAVSVWSTTCYAFRNVDGTTPFDGVTPAESTGAAGTTFTPTGVTTGTDDAYVLSLVSGRNANGKFLNTAQGFSLLGGNRGYATSASADWGMGLAGKLIPSVTAVTNPTWEQSGSAVWIGITASLRQAAAVPAAPTNPAAAAQSSSSILVTWDDVADETGYRVDRSPDGTGSWADVSGNLAADTVSYLDTGLTAGTQYFYRVIAFNAVGDSSPSSTVNATTSASGNRMGGTGAIRKPPRYS